MAKLVPFQRKSDGAIVMINPDYVIAVDPYRQAGWSVIFTTGSTKTGPHSQSYVVTGQARAVAKKLNSAGPETSFRFSDDASATAPTA